MAVRRRSKVRKVYVRRGPDRTLLPGPSVRTTYCHSADYGDPLNLYQQFGAGETREVINALAGKLSPKISLRNRLKRSPYRESVIKTVIVTISARVPPASSRVLPSRENASRTWLSKSPASDLPEASAAPI